MASGWVILAAGAVFRVVFAFRASGSFGLDGNRHDKLLPIARNLLESGFFSMDGIHPNVSEEPIFPAIIALSYALPGPEWIGYMLVQSVIAGLGAWAVYLFCTLASLPRPQGLLAAALFFSHPYLASQAASISDTPLFASVLAAIAAAWMGLQVRNTPRLAVAAGACLAVGFLTRGTTLLVLPTIAVFFAVPIWKERGAQSRTCLRNLLLAFTVTAVTILPWGARNWMLTDSFFIATHGRAEFAIGNNSFVREALEFGLSLDSIDFDPTGAIATLAQRAGPPGSPLYQLTYENLARERGVDWARNNLSEFLALVPLRLQKTWSWNLTPIFAKGGVIRPNYHRRAFVIRSFLIPISLLALLGLLHPGLWNRSTVFCAALLFAFSCAVAVLYGYTRLRAPFDTFLIVPAVQGLDWLLGRWRRDPGGS